jgi:hypothetical protein
MASFLQFSPPKLCMRLCSPLPLTCYKSRQSHSSQFDHPNKLQICNKKYIIFKFLTLFLTVISLLTYGVLHHPMIVFFLPIDIKFCFSSSIRKEFLKLSRGYILQLECDQWGPHKLYWSAACLRLLARNCKELAYCDYNNKRIIRVKALVQVY